MALTVNPIGDNPQTPGIAAQAYLPDQLIAGRFPMVTTMATIGAGTLSRGTVLGQITASGNYIESVATAVDGSQNPVAILADNADASGGAVQAPIYETGEFNENRVIYDASWTLPKLQEALRPMSIFLKSVLTADDPT